MRTQTIGGNLGFVRSYCFTFSEAVSITVFSSFCAAIISFDLPNHAVRAPKRTPTPKISLPTNGIDPITAVPKSLAAAAAYCLLADFWLLGDSTRALATDGLHNF